MLLHKGVGIAVLLVQTKQYSSESRETHIDLSSCVMHAFFDLLFCLGYILIYACVFNNSMLYRERALKTTVCSHSFRPEDYPW